MPFLSFLQLLIDYSHIRYIHTNENIWGNFANLLSQSSFEDETQNAFYWYSALAASLNYQSFIAANLPKKMLHAS